MIRALFLMLVTAGLALAVPVAAEHATGKHCVVTLEAPAGPEDAPAWLDRKADQLEECLPDRRAG